MISSATEKTSLLRGKSFGNLLVSTKENGVLVDGYLYVGGYGYQVGTYRYSDQEIIHLQETLPDYTKAFAAFNENHPIQGEGLHNLYPQSLQFLS